MNPDGVCIIAVVRQALNQCDGKQAAEHITCANQALGMSVQIVAAMPGLAYGANIEVAGFEGKCNVAELDDDVLVHFNRYQHLEIDEADITAGAFQSSTHRADAADAIISKGVESCASVLEFLEVTREPTTMVSMTFESNTGRIRGWGSTSCCRDRPDFDTTLNELFATSK